MLHLPKPFDDRPLRGNGGGRELDARYRPRRQRYGERTGAALLHLAPARPPC